MRTVNTKLERFIARITGDMSTVPRVTMRATQNDIIFFRDKSRRSDASDRALISRLARERKVHVVGNSLAGMPSNVLYVSPPEEGTELSYEMDPVVSEHVSVLNIQNPILWFTSPAYSDLIDSVEHSLVIYDCTRRVSDAPGGQLSRIQEDYLLSFADAVFTWDKDSYVSKRAVRSNVFRFDEPRDGRGWDAVVRSIHGVIGSVASRTAYWDNPKNGRYMFALG